MADLRPANPTKWEISCPKELDPLVNYSFKVIKWMFKVETFT